MAQWKLTLADRFGGIAQCFGDVLCLEVWKVLKNFRDRLPVRDQTDHRRNWYAHSPDAWQAAHHIGLDGDPLEGHLLSIMAQTPLVASLSGGW